MRALTKDRIRLIRAMQAGANQFSTFSVERMEIENAIFAIRGDEGQHFLSFSQDDPTKVSYASKPELRYDCERRTKTTLARYLRRRLKVTQDDLSDKALNILNSKVFGILVAETNGDAGFEFVTGTDITEAYRYGYGSSSCMSGTTRLTELYALNPDKIKMLKYDRDGIQARAIVWNFDGQLAIDRIYPNSGHHIDAIREWAKRKGYDIRRTNSAECTSFVSGRTYTITLHHNGTFPFMDTLIGGEVYGSTVEMTNGYDQPHGFQSTDGGYSDDDGDYCTCYDCGNRVHTDDSFTDPDGYNVYCEGCYYESFTSCHRCGEGHANDDMTYIEGYGDICASCRDNYYSYCEECEEWHESDDLTWIEDSSRYLCENCMGNADITFCDTCGEWHEETKTYYIEETDENTCDDPHENQIEMTL